MQEHSQLINIDIHSQYKSKKKTEALLLPIFCKYIGNSQYASSADISNVVKSCKYMSNTMIEQEIPQAIESAMQEHDISKAPIKVKDLLVELQKDATMFDKRLKEAQTYRCERFEIVRNKLHNNLPSNIKQEVLQDVQNLVQSILMSEEIGAFLLKRSSEISSILYTIDQLNTSI